MKHCRSVFQNCNQVDFEVMRAINAFIFILKLLITRVVGYKGLSFTLGYKSCCLVYRSTVYVVTQCHLAGLQSEYL